MLPAKTARTRSVGTKLSEEEYARLEALASQRGLTVGDQKAQTRIAVQCPAAGGCPPGNYPNYERPSEAKMRGAVRVDIEINKCTSFQF